MRRLITLSVAFALGAFLIHPTSGQQPASVQRIGFLGPATPSSLSEVFRQGLAELGYVDGGNITIESRWPEGGRLDRLPESAVELVSLKPDVIFAVGATAVRAAKGATTDIPIVFAGVVDPVASGLVASMERPGGNITGLTTFDPQQPKNQLEILREAIPGLARVAVLGDAEAAPAMFQATENAARALGLKTQVLKVLRAPNPDFEGAFEAAKKEDANAVVVLSTPVTTPNRKRIAELAAKYRLPIISPRDHADAGGLISYGTGFNQTTRRAATYVEKILKGAKPAELSVETVAQHELILNLKTAREIGVTFPPAMLNRANEVIQ